MWGRITICSVVRPQSPSSGGATDYCAHPPRANDFKLPTRYQQTGTPSRDGWEQEYITQFPINILTDPKEVLGKHFYMNWDEMS